jgi:hypothetical protein
MHSFLGQFEFSESCVILSHVVGPCHHGMAILRLRIEEWPLIRRVAANKMNKQSQAANEGWSFSLGVGQGSNNPSL